MEVKKLRQRIAEGLTEAEGACILASQQTSSFQFVSEDKLHYMECAISSRGCVADVGDDVPAKVFDVYCAPTREKVRQGIVAVLRERFFNDIQAANELLTRLKKDDVIGDDTTISLDEVTESRCCDHLTEEQSEEIKAVNDKRWTDVLLEDPMFKPTLWARIGTRIGRIAGWLKENTIGRLWASKHDRLSRKLCKLYSEHCLPNITEDPNEPFDYGQYIVGKESSVPEEVVKAKVASPEEIEIHHRAETENSLGVEVRSDQARLTSLLRRQNEGKLTPEDGNELARLNAKYPDLH